LKTEALFFGRSRPFSVPYLLSNSTGKKLHPETVVPPLRCNQTETEIHPLAGLPFALFVSRLCGSVHVGIRPDLALPSLRRSRFSSMNLE
jgi:hypothetical protein